MKLVIRSPSGCGGQGFDSPRLHHLLYENPKSNEHDRHSGACFSGRRSGLLSSGPVGMSIERRQQPLPRETLKDFVLVCLARSYLRFRQEGSLSQWTRDGLGCVVFLLIVALLYCLLQ